MAAKLASRNLNQTSEPQVHDDQHRYTPVTVAGQRIYQGAGLLLTEAVRLASTMFHPAGVARVEAGGTLTAGSLQRSGDKLAFVAAQA